MSGCPAHPGRMEDGECTACEWAARFPPLPWEDEAEPGLVMVLDGWPCDCCGREVRRPGICYRCEDEDRRIAAQWGDLRE